MSPAMTPAAYKPDDSTSEPHTPTAEPLLVPERAEIQRAPEPVAHSTERPHTASPDQHGLPHTSPHTTAAVTPTPILDDDDIQQFHVNRVEAVPARGDVVDPMQLPPLPTTRSQTAHLDIFHGGEEGGQAGAGRDESSGSGEGGSSDDSSSGTEVGAAVTPTQVWAETISKPSWLPEMTTGPELGVETTLKPLHLPEITLQHVDSEILTPEPGLPVGSGDAGQQQQQQPAVVFKEDVTPAAALTVDLDPLLAFPAGGEETSAKPPFHLIIVNIHDKNQSGESNVWFCPSFLYVAPHSRIIGQILGPIRPLQTITSTKLQLIFISLPVCAVMCLPLHLLQAFCALGPESFT